MATPTETGVRRWRSRSEAETEAIGEQLGRELGGGTLLLSGELGSGKTVLVRGLARALGVEAGEVQSPTYTLIHQHRGSRGELVHVDLYRLEAGDLEAIGLEELLAGEGLKAVEWAERLPAELARGDHLEIRRLEGGEREIVLRSAR